jgi:hypothetical protein
MEPHDDTQLQIMEHLRALRLEMASLHAKIDALTARFEDAIEGDAEDDD